MYTEEENRAAEDRLAEWLRTGYRGMTQEEQDARRTWEKLKQDGYLLKIQQGWIDEIRAGGNPFEDLLREPEPDRDRQEPEEEPLNIVMRAVPQ